MRNKNYRREQEVLHYSKRVNNMITKGLLTKEQLDNGDMIIYGSGGMKHRLFHDHTYGNEYGPRATQEEVKKKSWVKQLRNGNILRTKMLNSYYKKRYNRNYRHFSKMVDYKIPEKIFLDRCQVIYPRDIV